ncbi:MAG TPA: AsmA family protein, partial [Rhodospirillales bacterium]|nr:AsmA family protein [Rhodospirillales bacterium]
MKKIFSGVIGLILVLAAVVLIVPGFVDWNEYKAEIAARAKAATGRDLVIGGDIQISVLPSPALIAYDVTLANLEGATAPDMVRLRLLQVRVALEPLLGGNIQVETVKLVDPIIELEALADGRKNWEFRPSEKKGKEPAPDAKQDGGPDT